jgi:hypothetical protein
MDVEAVLSRSQAGDFARDVNPVAALLEVDRPRDAALANRLEHADGPFTFLGHFPHTATLGRRRNGLTDDDDSR